MSGVLASPKGYNFIAPPVATDIAGAVSGVAGPTITFSNLNIGAASAKRRLFVFVGCRIQGTVAPTITGVTVGGVSATRIVVFTSTGGTSFAKTGVFTVDLPTGTTANVVISTGSSSTVETHFFAAVFSGSTDDTYDTRGVTFQSGEDINNLSYSGIPAGNALILVGAMYSRVETGTITQGGGTGPATTANTQVVTGTSSSSFVVGYTYSYWDTPPKFGYSFPADGGVGCTAVALYGHAIT